MDNPYSPPVEVPNTDTDHGVHVPEDLDQKLMATKLTPLVKVAAAFCAVSGGTLLANALQLWGAVTLWGWFKYVPIVFTLLGLVFFYLSAKIYRQRLWAAWLGTALNGIVFLGMFLWFVLAAGSGFLSLLLLLSPIFCLTALVLTALSIGHCQRTTVIRRRLAAEGLNVDF